MLLCCSNNVPVANLLLDQPRRQPVQQHRRGVVSLHVPPPVPRRLPPGFVPALRMTRRRLAHWPVDARLTGRTSLRSTDRPSGPPCSAEVEQLFCVLSHLFLIVISCSAKTHDLGLLPCEKISVVNNRKIILYLFL